MFKKIMSIKYSELGFNAALLLLRLTLAVTMAPHGYSKLTGYSENADGFMTFMGLPGPVSLILVIFAELFCSIFVGLGLFTRLATIPLIIAMGVAFFQAHSADLFGKGFNSAIYLVCFICILLVGPGKFSVDGVVKK